MGNEWEEGCAGVLSGERGGRCNRIAIKKGKYRALEIRGLP
jgi:hypothetical protein